jgi:signal transduction histidine kinase
MTCGGASRRGWGLLLLPFGLQCVVLTAAQPELAALTERVAKLTRTRTDAVDTAATELRRIERDLHDGAQARLVALGMSLQAAERMFARDPRAALALVTEASTRASR